MSLSDCRIITLPKINTFKGNLTFIEANYHIPFDIKRVYYVYDNMNNINRGGHVHTNLHQLIIAIKGCFDVILDDGFEKKDFQLDKPYLGLFVPPMIWHEFKNLASEDLCLVLASKYYNENETLKSYSIFKKLVEEKNFHIT